MTIDADGRGLMVTEWRLPGANSSRDVPIPERWQRFLLDFAPTIAPNLHFAGLLEAWACPYDDGRMWILGILSSESSLDEGLNTWLAATGAADSPTDDIKMIRSCAGPLADIAHNIPGTSPRSFETDAASPDRITLGAADALASPGGRGPGLRPVRRCRRHARPADRASTRPSPPGPDLVADTGDEMVTIVALFTFSSPTRKQIVPKIG